MWTLLTGNLTIRAQTKTISATFITAMIADSLALPNTAGQTGSFNGSRQWLSRPARKNAYTTRQLIAELAQSAGLPYFGDGMLDQNCAVIAILTHAAKWVFDLGTPPSQKTERLYALETLGLKQQGTLMFFLEKYSQWPYGSDHN